MDVAQPPRGRGLPPRVGMRGGAARDETRGIGCHAGGSHAAITGDTPRVRLQGVWPVPACREHGVQDGDAFVQQAGRDHGPTHGGVPGGEEVN
eukprot:383018-Rhodomonas_salina.2